MRGHSSDVSKATRCKAARSRKTKAVASGWGLGMQGQCQGFELQGQGQAKAKNGLKTKVEAKDKQGRIYCKPGPVQKKMWGPRAPNTIIGLLLPPTVVVSWRLQCVCQSTVPQHRQSTLDTDASATHKFFILFITSMTFEQFLCVGTLQKFFLVLMWRPHFCGGPCSAEHAEHA